MSSQAKHAGRCAAKKKSPMFAVCAVLFAAAAVMIGVSLLILFGPDRPFDVGDRQSKSPVNVSYSVPHTERGDLAVRPICQYPDWPTGCEIVSAAIVLDFNGIDVSVATLVDDYLPQSLDFYYPNGNIFAMRRGPDLRKVFVGDPRSENSYGCFAPVIAQLMRDYLPDIGKDPARVRETTGTSLDDLCRDYIDKGIPVIMWATGEMKEVRPGATWRLDDGTEFTFPTGEHCLVLIGYTDTTFTFADPQKTAYATYPRDVVLARFADLGKQSVVLMPEDS